MMKAIAPVHCTVEVVQCGGLEPAIGFRAVNKAGVALWGRMRMNLEAAK